MKDLIIFPYSGTAIEALDCLGDTWRCTGFISDDEKVIGQEKYGIKIYNRTAFKDFPNAKILAIHGSPTSFLKRESIIDSLQISKERFANVIHPSASIGLAAKIGFNILIMAGAVITFNATIGNHVVILPNSVIHHDAVIGDFTLIAANATVAGNVRIGKNCYIGASSSIKNDVTIGELTLIGMGANVTKSYNKPCTLIGNPAKPYR